MAAKRKAYQEAMQNFGPGSSTAGSTTTGPPDPEVMEAMMKLREEMEEVE